MLSLCGIGRVFFWDIRFSQFFIRSREYCGLLKAASCGGVKIIFPTSLLSQSPALVAEFPHHTKRSNPKPRIGRAHNSGGLDGQDMQRALLGHAYLEA